MRRHGLTINVRNKPDEFCERMTRNRVARQIVRREYRALRRWGAPDFVARGAIHGLLVAASYEVKDGYPS